MWVLSSYFFKLYGLSLLMRQAGKMKQAPYWRLKSEKKIQNLEGKNQLFCNLRAITSPG